MAYDIKNDTSVSLGKVIAVKKKHRDSSTDVASTRYSRVKAAIQASHIQTIRLQELDGSGSDHDVNDQDVQVQDGQDIGIIFARTGSHERFIVFSDREYFRLSTSPTAKGFLVGGIQWLFTLLVAFIVALPGINIVAALACLYELIATRVKYHYRHVRHRIYYLLFILCVLFSYYPAVPIMAELKYFDSPLPDEVSYVVSAKTQRDFRVAAFLIPKILGQDQSEDKQMADDLENLPARKYIEKYELEDREYNFSIGYDKELLRQNESVISGFSKVWLGLFTLMAWIVMSVAAASAAKSRNKISVLLDARVKELQAEYDIGSHTLVQGKVKAKATAKAKTKAVKK
jgi:hypothetical protein